MRSKRILFWLFVIVLLSSTPAVDRGGPRAETYGFAFGMEMVLISLMIEALALSGYAVSRFVPAGIYVVCLLLSAVLGGMEAIPMYIVVTLAFIAPVPIMLEGWFGGLEWTARLGRTVDRKAST